MTARPLVAHALFKRFKRKQVLDGFDLELEPGQITVILGENGSGKTTLMNLALGVLRPDGGRITVEGLDPVKHAREVRRAIGFVPSVPDAYGWMTVEDLFKFLAPQYPVWDQAKGLELVDRLEVPLSRRFEDLSRGEGMKAMLCAALAPDPRILLLDEPFAGLDPLVREEVLGSVIGELQDGRRTILCATHDLDVAARIADRIVLLRQGRCAAHDTLEAILGDQQPNRISQRLHKVLEETMRDEEVELPC